MHLFWGLEDRALPRNTPQLRKPAASRIGDRRATDKHGMTVVMKPETEATLAAAERVCADRDLAFTPIRRRVLELLADAGQPVKAYDLLAQLKPGAHAQPPTVYRALDFLTKTGLVHKVEALNAYTACSHGDGHGDVAELYICELCNTVSERHSHRHSESAPDGFVVDRSVIEHFGRCAKCATA